jgi:transcriptional regulator
LQAGYRVHAGQMTKTKLKTVIKNVEIIRKRALELLTKDQQIQLKKDIQNFIPFRKKIGNIGKSIIFEMFSEDVALKILKLYVKVKLIFK